MTDPDRAHVRTADDRPPTPAEVLRRHLRINGLSHAADQPLVNAIAGAFAELHPEVALLRDMAVLDLRPGDILVLSADEALTEQQVDYLRQQMRERFPGHKIAVLERLQLAVVRPGQGAPA